MKKSAAALIARKQTSAANSPVPLQKGLHKRSHTADPQRSLTVRLEQNPFFLTHLGHPPLTIFLVYLLRSLRICFFRLRIEHKG